MNDKLIKEALDRLNLSTQTSDLDLIRRRVGALSARQLTEDDRETAEATKRWGTFANSDTRQGAFERDAFIAGYMARATVPDVKGTEVD